MIFLPHRQFMKCLVEPMTSFWSLNSSIAFQSLLILLFCLTLSENLSVSWAKPNRVCHITCCKLFWGCEALLLIYRLAEGGTAPQRWHGFSGRWVSPCISDGFIHWGKCISTTEGDKVAKGSFCSSIKRWQKSWISARESGSLSSWVPEW